MIVRDRRRGPRRPCTVHAPSDPGRRRPTPPHLPAQIGKYRVLRRLGEGATSEVFLCRDDFRGRDVAIKRVRASALADTLDGRYYERFFAAEAALVGRLQHPNVVQIFDAVADPEAPYMVMEYVDGSTLRPYCRADQLLSLELIVEIGFKCAMALGYVYRQGLIHRDVKPANILAVLSNGSITDIKISDFGSVLNIASDVTQVYRVGSLAYMSPEQLDGSALDCRADMYSLARGAVPPDHRPAAVRRAGAGGAGEPDLPRRAARRWRAARRRAAGLDAVILRALAKRPDDRYAGWDEFAQALSALITNREVPRGQLQGVLDSERFNLLRTLEFFSSFGDVELWEVVHRASWQRFGFGHALYRKGEEGRSFHIIAQGEVEVFRDGKQVAQLGAGTSVGEMAYLAPSPELRLHSADVSSASRPRRSRSPRDAGPGGRRLPPPVRRGVHPRAGAAPARRPRDTGAPAAHSLSAACGRVGAAEAACGGLCRATACVINRGCSCTACQPPMETHEAPDRRHSPSSPPPSRPRAFGPRPTRRSWPAPRRQFVKKCESRCRRRRATARSRRPRRSCRCGQDQLRQASAKGWRQAAMRPPAACDKPGRRQEARRRGQDTS